MPSVKSQSSEHGEKSQHGRLSMFAANVLNRTRHGTKDGAIDLLNGGSGDPSAAKLEPSGPPVAGVERANFMQVQRHVHEIYLGAYTYTLK